MLTYNCPKQRLYKSVRYRAFTSIFIRFIWILSSNVRLGLPSSGLPPTDVTLLRQPGSMEITGHSVAISIRAEGRLFHLRTWNIQSGTDQYRLRATLLNTQISHGKNRRPSRLPLVHVCVYNAAVPLARLHQQPVVVPVAQPVQKPPAFMDRRAVTMFTGIMGQTNPVHVL